MKTLLLFLCSVCFISFTTAQNYSHEFGKCNEEEFQLQRYERDPSAEAVVIYDIGKSYFILSDDGYELYFERKIKYKIFTKAGLEWAEFSIPLFKDGDKSEKLVELNGNTYNKENGIVRTTVLKRENSFKEKKDENWYNIKFAMPDVKEGSIIEISYKVTSPFFFNYHNWEFQNRIPVIYSEFTGKMIPFYEYTYLFQGASKFDEYKSYVDDALPHQFGSIEYHDMVYYFVMKNLPAFKDESYITSVNDYIIKLNFQLSAIHHPNRFTEEILTTWNKMSAEMTDDDSFGKYLNACKKKGKEVIDGMQIGLKSPLEKTKIIDRYVKSNFNWNGRSNKYASESLKELLSGKTGNSADINLYLAGLLNAAGIEAYPVLLSTRSHGKIKYDYPFLHFFNYVIVVARIDSLSILLDATQPLSCFNEIPSECLNDKGMIIQKDKVEWVLLRSTTISNTNFSIVLKPDPVNDSIYQKCKITSTGYEAIYYRNKYASSYHDLREQMFGINAIPGDTIKAVNIDLPEQPFELDFHRQTVLENLEDKIIISPFCDLTITENPLKQPVRNLPLDFIFKKSKKMESVILIPNGYKLLSKPDDMKIDNALVEINFTTNIQNDGSIKIVGEYSFKKEIYPVIDYFDLKRAFNKIIDKFNEKLVLVKV